ncbi:serine/threonine-protein kinase [Pseudonocardia lacus]|uniref:serine/threonine-protein kinase n=1 Tax=Pseudonocardia lacus TaxID=2835865 RepID=UPI001BDDADF4|nr:serine/threonine-protein kinase [Pseudonocardia lacus]
MDELFGRYRLRERIGRGGMGEVFRAHDTAQDRVVAIKRLSAQLDADERDVLEVRLRREARRMAELAVPNVMPVLDSGTVDGRFYLVMPYVQGSDLAAVLRAGPLAPARAVAVVRQLADALDHAHAAGLVHRDVKPSNALLVTGPAGRDAVYLLDFGIALATSGTRSTRLTAGVVGTPEYMAPERLVDDVAVDHRVDVYALACVLSECLTGRPPFTGTPAAVLGGHLHRAPPRPGDVDPVLRGFDGVVARGMAKDPDRRFGSAGELAAAAEAALTGPVPPLSTPAPETGSPSGPTAVGTGRRRRRDQRRWRALVGLLAAAVVVAGTTATVLLDRAPADPGTPTAPGAVAGPVLVDVALDGAGALAVDEANGALLVSDPVAGRVIRRDLRSDQVRVIAGPGATGPAGAPELGLRHPAGLAVLPDGNLFVADPQAHRVFYVGLDGTAATWAGTGEAGFSGDGEAAVDAQLNSPEAVLLEPGARLLIADTGNHRVRRMGPDGIIDTAYGTGAAEGEFAEGELAAYAALAGPAALALSPRGDLHVAQPGVDRVSRIDAIGSATTAAGSGERGFSGDGGPAAAAALSGPSGVAIAPDGSLLVADRVNHRVRRVAPDGTISTLVGTGEPGRSADGTPAEQARLSSPTGVAAGADGAVYVSDDGRVLRVDPGGATSTVLD